MLLSYFKPITADEALNQHRRIASQSSEQHALKMVEKERLLLAKRGPGRPPKPVELLAIDQSKTLSSENTSPRAPSKRGKYVNWWTSPYIHDILAAYRLNLNSPRRTVDYLQRTFPCLPTESSARFDELSESTIRSWFDDKHKLLPKFQTILNEGKTAAARGLHGSHALAGYPQIEDEIKSILNVMRNEAGAVVNIHIIRWVMRAVMEAKEPILLTQLNLSKG